MPDERADKEAAIQLQQAQNQIAFGDENTTKTDKAEQIFNTSMEQLKNAKKVSLGALGKVKQTEVKLDN